MGGGRPASRHLETGGRALFCLVLARVGCANLKYIGDEDDYDEIGRSTLT